VATPESLATAVPDWGSTSRTPLAEELHVPSDPEKRKKERKKERKRERERKRKRKREKNGKQTV
jgi:hypothetical protein